MSSALAAASTANMGASGKPKDPEMMKKYMETLINPFSLAIKSPKLYDGELKYSAGLKLRATGEVACSATTNTNIIIFPGLTNIICFCTNPIPTGPINVDGTIFRQHISTNADRLNVRLARLTGAGARFFLTNSAEEDDGYWEAARITTQTNADALSQLDSSGTLTATVVPRVRDPDFDLSNNPTYQFGRLRDIHKMVFKLNSTDNDHKFSVIAGLSAAPDTSLTAMADFDQWDMIFIKVRGRRNTISPSVLRFDTVANQEVVYVETSPLARMMDETPRDDKIDAYLEHSRVDLPAFQAID